jgi:predicted MPP superfamily phosphohydrolase
MMEKALFVVVVLGVIGLIIAGHINANRPRIRSLNLTIEKRASCLRALNVVVASDLHLGRNLSGRRLTNIIEMINGLEPDLVLLPGDTMDEDVDALSERDMAMALQKIRARYGVFGVTGNHEYYRGLEETVDYLTQGNVTVLEDKRVKVADALYVIGRKDRTSMYMGNPRKSLKELMEGLDHQYPFILMDHQPFNLEEAHQHSIDLQISGHTHHGQLFPFNLITKALYEISWGYLSKGGTQYYVSCGAGAWGPPVRLGSVPEIVRIKISFVSPHTTAQ